MESSLSTLRLGSTLHFDRPVKSLFIETRRSTSIRKNVDVGGNHFHDFNPEGLILDCDEFCLNFRQAYRYFSLLDGGAVDGRLFRECLNANIQWLELTTDDFASLSTIDKLVYGFEIKFPYPVSNLTLRNMCFDRIGRVSVFAEFSEKTIPWSVKSYDVKQTSGSLELHGKMQDVCLINMNEWILRRGYANQDFKVNVLSITKDAQEDIITRYIFQQKSQMFLYSYVYHWNAFNLGDIEQTLNILFHSREIRADKYSSVSNDYNLFWIEK